MRNLKEMKVTGLKNSEVKQIFGGGAIKATPIIDPVSPVLDLLKALFI